MPRYLVERTFPDTLSIPMNESGAQVCQTVVTNNAEGLVTKGCVKPRALALGIEAASSAC
jgi:hypothetical protein